MKLEARMRENFPEDPTLTLFSRRFVAPEFDPRAVRVIVSPAAQSRPKAIPTSSVGAPPAVQDSPPNPITQTGNSPKRPLPMEDSDTEGGRPRKMARPDSPLKGAAGRRLLDHQKRARQNETPHYDGASSVHAPPPPSLHPDITFFLSQLPRTQIYNDSGTAKISPSKAVQLLRDVYIPTDPAEVERRMRSRPAPLHVPQPPLQHLQQPPPMPQQINYGQPMNLGQHLPPMPPMPPQQHAQYNGGYPMFPLQSNPPLDPLHALLLRGGGNETSNGYGQGSASHPQTPTFRDPRGPSFATAPPHAQNMSTQNPFGEPSLTSEQVSVFIEEQERRLRAHAALLPESQPFLR